MLSYTGAMDTGRWCVSSALIWFVAVVSGHTQGTGFERGSIGFLWGISGTLEPPEGRFQDAEENATLTRGIGPWEQYIGCPLGWVAKLDGDTVSMTCAT